MEVLCYANTRLDDNTNFFMRVLGIETSCDDTGVGIVWLSKEKIAVEAQVTASQVLAHRKYGGVVPEVAAREHALTILPTIQGALKKAKKQWSDIDAIAVTAGPGLNTALVVGVEAARTLSYSLKKPLVRVNHIEGHILSAWASPEAQKIRFPVVVLIVSGGHTELILMKKIGHYRLLGRTHDDAVGEAFDKVAKILGLAYPGGPAVAARAERGDNQAYAFPRAMMEQASLDFSYSGLKTSVLYKVDQLRRRSPKTTNDLCSSFQRAAVDPLIEKTFRAAKRARAKTVILAGGVAANKLLRRDLAAMVTARLPGVVFVPPVLPLCMDNGVMIAIAGAFYAQRRNFTPWHKIKADPNWELVT